MISTRCGFSQPVSSEANTGLYQDKSELDIKQLIESASLGIPTVLQFGMIKLLKLL